MNKTENSCSVFQAKLRYQLKSLSFLLETMLVWRILQVFSQQDFLVQRPSSSSRVVCYIINVIESKLFKGSVLLCLAIGTLLIIFFSPTLLLSSSWKCLFCYFFELLLIFFSFFVCLTLVFLGKNSKYWRLNKKHSLLFEKFYYTQIKKKCTTERKEYREYTGFRFTTSLKM